MKFLRIKQVMEKTGLSRVTIWRMENAGLFPSRRRLSSHTRAHVEEEVDAWIESRPQVFRNEDSK